MGQTQSEQIPQRKAVSYLPAVDSFLTAGPAKRNKKVLVIGSGCAGLGAAWHLNRAGVDVTVYEALEKLGGHANTINGMTKVHFRSVEVDGIFCFSLVLSGRSGCRHWVYGI